MKISVIVPSFNQGQFIGRTVESILSQKGDFEVECIVCDGGSTDDTKEVLKEFERKIDDGKYKNLNKGITLSWVSKKDNGQSDAINQGLKKSTGDIIAYLNSDDSYTEGSFANVIDGFKKNKSKIWLTGYCNVIDAEDRSIRNFISQYKNFWLRRYSYRKLLVLNFVSQPATFWKRSIMDKFQSFDEKLHYTMDYDYWLKLGKEQDPIIIRRYLANFRIHGQSKGETSYIEQFNQDLGCAKNNTTNWYVLAVHRFHNFLVKCVYRLIK